MKGCLLNIEGRDKHVGKNCGCRLVLLNKKLLADPDKLPNGYWVPFIMQAEDKTHKKVITFGMVLYHRVGQNQPLIVYNDKSIKICEGEYSLNSIQAILGKGRFSLSCFGNKLKGKGNIAMEYFTYHDSNGKLITNRGSIGHGKTSDGGMFNFLTNIHIDHLSEVKHLLE